MSQAAAKAQATKDGSSPPRAQRRAPRIPYKPAEDFYEAVGVVPDCTQEDLRRARKKMLLRTHSDKRRADRHPERTRAQYECFEKIFAIMLDARLRGAYDRLKARRLLPRHGGLRTDFVAVRKCLDDELNPPPPPKTPTTAPPAPLEKGQTTLRQAASAYRRRMYNPEAFYYTVDPFPL